MSSSVTCDDVLGRVQKSVQGDSSSPHDLVLRFDSTLGQTFHETKTEMPKRLNGLDRYEEVKSRGTWAADQKQKFRSILNVLKDVPPEALIVELGGFQAQKAGDILSRFSYYVPVDIEQTSMIEYAEKFQSPAIVANAESLPFNDNSVDVVMTHAFLEHPFHPEKVVNEIIRVVRPGGIVIHNDAWFCRWWQRFGVVGLKSFRTMNLKERLVAAAAKTSEFPLVRFPPILIRRAWREVTRHITRHPELRYRKLKPNFDLNIGCDEHATASIDPLDVIHVYEKHGFETMQRLNLLERVILRPDFVALVRAA